MPSAAWAKTHWLTANTKMFPTKDGHWTKGSLGTWSCHSTKDSMTSETTKSRRRPAFALRYDIDRRHFLSGGDAQGQRLRLRGFDWFLNRLHKVRVALQQMNSFCVDVPNSDASQQEGMEEFMNLMRAFDRTAAANEVVTTMFQVDIKLQHVSSQLLEWMTVAAEAKHFVSSLPSPLMQPARAKPDCVTEAPDSKSSLKVLCSTSVTVDERPAPTNVAHEVLQESCGWRPDALRNLHGAQAFMNDFEAQMAPSMQSMWTSFCDSLDSGSAPQPAPKQSNKRDRESDAEFWRAPQPAKKPKTRDTKDVSVKDTSASPSTKAVTHVHNRFGKLRAPVVGEHDPPAPWRECTDSCNVCHEKRRPTAPVCSFVSLVLHVFSCLEHTFTDSEQHSQVFCLWCCLFEHGHGQGCQGSQVVRDTDSWLHRNHWVTGYAKMHPSKEGRWTKDSQETWEYSDVKPFMTSETADSRRRSKVLISTPARLLLEGNGYLREPRRTEMLGKGFDWYLDRFEQANSPLNQVHTFAMDTVKTDASVRGGVQDFVASHTMLECTLTARPHDTWSVIAFMTCKVSSLLEKIRYVHLATDSVW